MIYEIRNKDLSVKISDIGAEIKSVVIRGKQRAWQNESGAWNRTSPVLFPVCGRNAVSIGGKDFGCPFHGFARNSAFKAEKTGEDEAIFCLASDEETLAVYPFSFELKITYKIVGDSLRITNEIKNTGEATMPFALGRHDSFLLDAPIDGYKLCFNENERFLSERADENARLTGVFVDFGGGKEFVLPADFLVGGETVIFGGIGSDCVTLKTLDNEPIAKLTFSGINNLLLWRPDKERMICVELWSALPDKAGDQTDFMQKERLFKLSAGEKKTVSFEIKYY